MATAFPSELGRTRFVRRIICVLDVLPVIMKALATDLVKSTTMYYSIMNSAPYEVEKLTEKERAMTESLLTDSYDKCDITYIYKVIRQYLSCPAQGWGKAPFSSDVTLSDDIQRIRIAEKKLFYRPRATVTEEEHNQFFEEFKELARRRDQHLRVKGNRSFEEMITEVETRDIDDLEEERYIREVKEVEKMTLRRSDTTDEGSTINIFYGREIIACIDRVINGESEEERIRVIISGLINDNQIVEELKSVKDNLNQGNTEIEIEDIEHGSVILYLKVKSRVLQSEDVLSEKLVDFLWHVLSKADRSILQNTTVDAAIMGPDQMHDDGNNIYNPDPHEDDPMVADEITSRYNPNDLILTVAVDKTVASNPNQLYEATADLVSTILQRLEEHGTPIARDTIDVIIHPCSSSSPSPDDETKDRKHR